MGYCGEFKEREEGKDYAGGYAVGMSVLITLMKKGSAKGSLPFQLFGGKNSLYTCVWMLYNRVNDVHAIASLRAIDRQKILMSLCTVLRQ